MMTATSARAATVMPSQRRTRFIPFPAQMDRCPELGHPTPQSWTSARPSLTPAILLTTEVCGEPSRATTATRLPAARLQPIR